ncbi:MAG: LamG-like jellyroll fold domain-containing protein [Bacteroidota bacterium]
MNLLGKQHILTFSGQDAYIDLGPIPNFKPLDGMTFTSWVRPTKGESWQATILSHHYLEFEPQIQHGEFIFEAGQDVNYSGGKVVLGEWMHLATVVDPNRDSGQVRMFVNGVLTAAIDRPNPVNYQANTSLWIGQRPIGGGPLIAFHGDIASVGLWNRAMRDSEIKMGMHELARPDDSSLIGFWKLDEGNGTSIQDLSNKQYHGQLKGKGYQWNPIAPMLEKPHTMRQGRGLAQTWMVGTPLSFSSSPPPPPSPVAGRNGELERMKNKILQHKESQIKQAKIQAYSKKQVALDQAKRELDRAHRNAARMVNSTRFDYLYYINSGKVSRADPSGKKELILSTSKKHSIHVPTTSPSFSSGILVKKGDQLTFTVNGGLIGLMANISNRPDQAFPVFTGQKITIAQDGELIFIVMPVPGPGYQVDVTIQTQHVNPDSNHAVDLALDQLNQKLYLAKTLPPYGVNAMKIDGTELQDLYQTTGAVVSLTVDDVNGNLYWIETSGWIMTGKTSGSSSSQLVQITAPDQIEFLQLHLDKTNQRLYWTGNQGIWSCAVTGGTISMVISPHEAPRPIDVVVDPSGNHVYWLDKELKMLRRAKLDGTEVEDIYTVEHPIRGLEIDEVNQSGTNTALREIYWAEREEKLHPLTPNLVAHFPLDRTDTGVVVNQVNSAVAGKLHAVKWATSTDPRFQHLSDTVLQFDGAQSYVELPEHPSLQIPQYTIEMWIRPIKMPNELIAERGIVSKIYNQTRYMSFAIASLGRFRHAFAGNGVMGIADTPIDSIKWNTWQHVAITNDGQTAKTFIDGVEMSSGPVTAADSTITTPPSLLTQPGPMYLGKSILVPSKQDSFFRGDMNEVRMWNTALTAEQIKDNMKFYRKYYAVRGTINGSQHVEHLFEFPSEGGLQLASKLSLAHEQRALAYRTLKNNQVLAKHQIAVQQTASHRKVMSHRAQLDQQRQKNQKDIADAKANQKKQRADGQARLHTAKNTANKRIGNAQNDATIRRRNAHTQANQLKDKANGKARDMKQRAQAKRSDAQKKVDKYQK